MNTVQGHWRKKGEILPLLTGGEANEPQKLDLKPLPVELKYTYLEEQEQCPVVISSPQQPTGKQPAGHPQGEQVGYWVENH